MVSCLDARLRARPPSLVALAQSSFRMLLRFLHPPPHRAEVAAEVEAEVEVEAAVENSGYTCQSDVRS